MDRQCQHHAPHPRAYIQKSQTSNAALARELGIHSAPWRVGRRAGRSSIDPSARTA